MPTDREVMQQALEALELYSDGRLYLSGKRAIDALRTQLAKPVLEETDLLKGQLTKPTELTPTQLNAAIKEFKSACGGYASLGEKLTRAFRAATSHNPKAHK